MPDALQNLPPLREIVKTYGIVAEKKLGQNFLFDLNLTDKIARSAGALDSCTVIEIGPGPGALTRSLLSAGAKKVVAVEMDTRALHALQDYLVPVSGGRLELVQGDALSIQETEIASGNIKIIANLPYNIATTLLFKWLDNIQAFTSLTLMFQKEVAERIFAMPRTKAYGRVSVMAQWLCEIVPVMDIPPQAFNPPPKVTSSVITLVPRKAPLAPASKPVLEKLCKAVFGQRRKMLRKSLQQLTPQPESLLQVAGIKPERRPEELTVQEICALARAWEAETLHG